MATTTTWKCPKCKIEAEIIGKKKMDFSKLQKVREE